MDKGGHRQFNTDMVYTPHASPVIDALIDGESVDQLMVDSSGDYAIFMLDSNGHVASWNKGAQKVKGYSREESTSYLIPSTSPLLACSPRGWFLPVLTPCTILVNQRRVRGNPGRPTSCTICQ